MSVVLRSPNQSSAVYNVGGPPRQRNVFMVRFQPNHIRGSTTALTFVTKHCDRPKIVAKVEELNQYNKRRQIYTGFKMEPVRITFYDSADGAAQNMWAEYSRYYFDDFQTQPASAFSYDVTGAPFNTGAGRGFGLTETYEGNSDNASQWFFSNVTIFHFYTLGSMHMYDSYTLINPRISTFEPDELDYENSVVSQINMQLVFENLQYVQQQQVDPAAFGEFAQGAPFNGNPVIVPTAGGTTLDASTMTPLNPTGSGVASLLRATPAASLTAAAYRLLPSLPTGALAALGNYQFGGSFNLLNAQQTGTAQYGLQTGNAAGSIDPTSYINSLTAGLGAGLTNLST